MQDNELLKYTFGPGVEAFTTMRTSSLPYPVLCGHQTHGYKVGVVDREGMTREDFDGYDALVTNLPIAIGVRTADCIPVLLHDPVNHAVAAIHAGWKGTVQKIVLYTIKKMTSVYQTKAENLEAVIGPGISARNFQVGEDTINFFKESGFPLDLIWNWDGSPVKGTMQGGHHIDLKTANKWLLEQAGVLSKNIQVCDICTYDDERFFSARREGYECGRNINAIRLIR